MSTVLPSLGIPAADSEPRFHPITDPIEYVEDYRPGSFHPIHLGDVYKGSRYKIIRKLGYGSFSTVWLATDQERKQYVAIKFLTAAASSTDQELIILRYLSEANSDHLGRDHVLKLLDNFEHHGPNGLHHCFVFEPMGPSSASMFEELPWNQPIRYGRTPRYPVWMARSLLRQALLGLDFLHQNDIVHGDLQPGNILFSLIDINNIDEEDLAQSERRSNISRAVKRLDGKQDPWAPKYLVLKKSLIKFVDLSRDFRVKISDLGAAFFNSSPPEKPVTPVGLRSPELVFLKQISKSQDVWSFGCLLFEFLTGTPLFVVSDFGSALEEVDEEHILQFYDILGPIPDSLLSQWPRASTYFNEKGKKIKDMVGDDVPEESTLETGHSPDEISDVGNDINEYSENINSINEEDDQESDVDEYVSKSEDEASLEEAWAAFPEERRIAEEQGRIDEERYEASRNEEWRGYLPLEEFFDKEKPVALGDEEAEVVKVLLRRILQYDPAKRPSMKELLQHPWLHNGQGKGMGYD